jgi:hypothetical protein
MQNASIVLWVVLGIVLSTPTALAQDRAVPARGASVVDAERTPPPVSWPRETDPEQLRVGGGLLTAVGVLGAAFGGLLLWTPRSGWSFCSSDCGTRERDLTGADLAGGLVLGVSAAALATGIVFLVLGHTEGASQRRASAFLPWVAPTPGGASLGVALEL